MTDDLREQQFRSALQRPRNYWELTEEQQWSIDRQLGILDWPGPQDDYEWDRIREHHGLIGPKATTTN